MSVVRKVYVASSFQNMPGALRQALDVGGHSDIAMEQLPIIVENVFNTSLAEEAVSRIPDVEFLLAEPCIIAQVFDHPTSRLKWAQSTMAGIDRFHLEWKEKEKMVDFILTRRCDGFGRHMAEYILGQILSRERSFALTQDLQRARHFSTRHELAHYRNLDQLHLGVLGLGVIGQEVAQYCKAFGMTIWAAVRDERYSRDGGTSCGFVDHFRPMSRLHEMLESCDYFVSILPSTPHTINLLSGDVLKPCRHNKSVFINVGRGDVIDDDSIVNAINNGWLGGAILDVFNQEPLPSSSLLWDLPGVTITPHISATPVSGKAKSTDDFMHNLKCYLEGRPMRNVVDFSKGY